MLRATGCASMAENSKYAAVNYKYQVPCLTYALLLGIISRPLVLLRGLDRLDWPDQGLDHVLERVGDRRNDLGRTSRLLCHARSLTMVEFYP